MNSFNSSILLYINSFAGQSRAFDAVMHGFTNNYLLKTAPLIAILYGFWFKEEATPALMKEKRGRILSCFAAAAIAPVAARIIAMALPFRQRPFQEPELHFTLPTFINPAEAQMIDWSSFPSDNMVVLFALIAGIFVCSRRWGFAALAIGLVASFARIYSGIHHPTDVIAGAILGVAIFMLIDRTFIKTLLTKPVFFVMEKNRPVFYALFFLATDQIAHLFWESLAMLKYVFHGVKIQ